MKAAFAIGMLCALLVSGFGLSGCNAEQPEPARVAMKPAATTPSKPAVEKKSEPITKTKMNANYMVSLSEIVPSIIVDKPLATADNPFGIQCYRKKDEVYVRYGTAQKLAAVQKELQGRGLGLKVWAGYRPFIVQLKMFQAVNGNGNWVSDPYRKSGKKTHVRGVAVDCTLVDKNGKELEMPTAYLDFAGGAEKMKHTYRDLPKNVIANRNLLKEVMTRHGLEIYTGEWWHYQDQQWADYPIINMDQFPVIHKRLLTDELLAEAKKLKN